MNRIAFKIAASTAIIAMTMVACTSQSEAMRRLGSVRQADAPADRQASDFHASAVAALRAGDLAQAIDQMEQAVAMSPRDVGYRLLLADAYLKNGRFDSARATYSDVIELDSSNVRANLSVALIQISQGRPAAAVARLDEIASNAPAADVGLAYALAGQTGRAVEILESAARSPSATPRTRQNLALAHALAGDWRRARAIAAQDVSPADLNARMYQWARFSRPGAESDRVASLIGATPVQDPGQPVRLALTQAAEAYAEAAPVEAPVQSNSDFAPEAPAQVAAAEQAPAEAPAFWVPTAQSYQPVAEAVAAADEAPVPAPAEAPVRVASITPTPVPPSRETQVQYSAAARSLVQPRSPVIRSAAESPTSAPFFQRARPRPATPAVNPGNAPVVVQLGAFINEANAERAWLQHARSYNLQGRSPLTTTFNFNGRTIHRVSVSGFASAADARRLCGSIKSRGGVCFVRARAGDAAIRWAARYVTGRNRNV